MHLIKQYLLDRKQYTEINTKCSELLLTENLSVFQGSVLSVIFYNLFTLDIPFITHNILNNTLNHNSHYEYYKCGNPFSISYINDLFAVLEGDKDNIWIKIKNYIDQMKIYYTSNKLKINIKKSQIVLTGRNNPNGNINIDGKIISNKSNIKVLGTIFSDYSKFINNLK